MEDQDENKIENLKRSLYSRKGTTRSAHILNLHTHEVTVPEKWKEEEKATEEEYYAPKNILEIDPRPKSSFLKKALIISSVFFFVSIAIAFYVFFSGNNLISAEKINISMAGPVSVAAGEEMSLDVNITNQNSTAIELADLIATYPQGSRSAYDKTSDLPSERIPIGDLAPGETVKKTIKILPFGENAAKLSIKLSLEYRVPNSSSVFNKDVSYDFLVGSSPITLSFDALKEINSNQNISFVVTMVSNSTEVIKNMILSADFPFGFTLLSSDPNPLSGKFVWRLGDIEPQGKRVIKLSGKVVGENNQDRIFKFSAGTENQNQTGVIDAPLASIDHNIFITKPFIGSQILIGKEAGGDYVAKSGDPLNLAVAFENNLSVPVDDLVIQASLKGVGFLNESKLRAENGYYNSNKRIIEWTKQDQEDLAEILPGQNGLSQFYFDFLRSDDPKMSSVKNPVVTIDVTIKGKRLSESNVPEEITSTATRSIKLATNLKLAGSAVRSIGPIENQGSIPPKVGQDTDYTILWTVTNNFNDVDNAQVTAILPPYVKWAGVTSPSGEKVSYNPDSRQVTWDLGKVLAGSVSGSFRQVAFQISFTPSISQLDSAPNLLGISSLKGHDTFTNTDVSSSIIELNTILPTDPKFEYGQEKVIQ